MKIFFLPKAIYQIKMGRCERYPHIRKGQNHIITVQSEAPDLIPEIWGQAVLATASSLELQQSVLERCKSPAWYDSATGREETDNNLPKQKIGDKHEASLIELYISHQN